MLLKEAIKFFNAVSTKNPRSARLYKCGSEFITCSHFNWEKQMTGLGMVKKVDRKSPVYISTADIVIGFKVSSGGIWFKLTRMGVTGLGANGTGIQSTSTLNAKIYRRLTNSDTVYNSFRITFSILETFFQQRFKLQITISRCRRQKSTLFFLLIFPQVPFFLFSFSGQGTTPSRDGAVSAFPRMRRGPQDLCVYTTKFRV